MKIKRRLALITILILILSQIFIASLTVSSFNKLFLDAYVTNLNILQKYFKRNIENALRFGKPLQKFLGLKSLMSAYQKKFDQIDNILVFDPDGTILYALESPEFGETVPKIFLSTVRSAKAENSYGFTSYGSRYHVLEAIMGPQQDVRGYISFAFRKAVLERRIQGMWMHNLKVLSVITALAGISVVLLLYAFTPAGPDIRLSKRRMFTIILMVLAIAQITYSFINAKRFQDNYIRTTQENVYSLASLIKGDIERILRKNIALKNLKRVDQFFQQSITKIPEISGIQFLDADKRNLHPEPRPPESRAAATEPRAEQMSAYNITLPIMKTKSIVAAAGEDPEGTLEGYINVTISEEEIHTRVMGILSDSLTVTLISFLFTVELIILLSIFVDTRFSSGDLQIDTFILQRSSEMLGRPAAFSFLFMFALPLSFIPLHMENLYTPLFGLSKEVVLGMPLSVEMCCSLFSALMAGRLTDRFGWHIPFVFGVSLSIMGAISSGFAATGLQFILFRGLSGLGYGLAWMSIQGFVIKYASAQAKTRGVANLVAGIISGHICGTAVGAMIAERVGYQMIFFISAGLGILPILFVFFFMKPYMRRTRESRQKPAAFRDLLAFLSNRNIFAVLFFVIMPYSLAHIGLLLFATPIYLSTNGMSQSSIGRVMMIYGLTCVYVAPLIARLIDRSQNKRIFISLGGLVAGVGLILLNFQQGYTAIITAIFMLGLAASLGSAAQSAFILQFKITEELGSGTAVSIHRAADKLGQMLGPIVFGMLIANMGIEQGIVMTGIVILIAALLFTLVARD